MCEAVITIPHVILCVFFKNVLLLEYRHALFTSDNRYLDFLWTAAVVIEMALGCFFIISTMCDSRRSDDIKQSLMAQMVLLDLILQARTFYILYLTDLCKSRKMGDKWAEGDSKLITTFILTLLDNTYRYVMVCCRCKDMNGDMRCSTCMCYVIPTSLFSVANILTSLYYKCKLL